MMNDPLNSFLNEMQTNITKLIDKTNNMCARLDKIEERFLNMEIKLEANKLIYQEKSESNNYKLSVLEEKINNNNQKVNDLNNILMKHFAYKNNKNIQGTQGTQAIQGTQGTQAIQGTQGTQGTQSIQGTLGTLGTLGGTTTAPNPFALPPFNK